MEAVLLNLEECRGTARPEQAWQSLKFKWKENMSISLYISGSPATIAEFLESFDLDISDENRRTINLKLEPRPAQE